METLATSVVKTVSEDDLARVAAGALDASSASIVGTPEWSEITSPHNDLRTIGILRVSGDALVGGQTRDWSSVVKVIDMTADPGAAAHWINPELEEIVYEQGLFADDSLGFRPARCFGVTSPGLGKKLLWLEDLTSATPPPFGLDQLSSIARNLGQFNGYHHDRKTNLPFTPAVDSYKVRWDTGAFLREIHDLPTVAEEPVTKIVFQNASIESALYFNSLMPRLHERLAEQPRSLCFGDCAPLNLFINGSETVAVDWASLTMDPIGADLGVLVGAAMTSGRKGAEVARNERQIFETYLRSLQERVPEIDIDNVRRGYLAQLGFYLVLIATMPVTSSKPGKYFRPDYVEKRFESKREDIPALLTGVIDLIPGIGEELGNLLDN